MFEKVNPMHPDKVADRIAGAIVDLAVKEDENAKIAVEVQIGHDICNIITEGSVELEQGDIVDAIDRITGTTSFMPQIYQCVQDVHLSDNQKDGLRCGDNGIFKGCPITDEQKRLSEFARKIYEKCKSDGKYIIDGNDLIVCQSNMSAASISKLVGNGWNSVKINPLGDWTGGLSVDTGMTNRKLGSDMGDAVTGGGLVGKDLSKADVSVNIYCHLLAQRTGKVVTAVCAIGDEFVKIVCDGKSELVRFDGIVLLAKEYIKSIGGFEAMSEWGLI